MKKYILLVISFFIFLLCGCEKEKMIIECDDVMEIGYNYDYDITYLNNKIDYKDVYVLVDYNIIEVYKNHISPLKEGITNLRVVMKENGEIYATKQIKVVKPICNSVKLKLDKDEIYVNESIKLDYIIDTPYDINEIKKTWVSSDDNIASVKDGLVVAKNPGTVNITLLCGKHQDTVILNVLENITELNVEFENEIYVNEVTYVSCNMKDVVLTTSDNNIEIIGNYIHGLSEGKAIIHIEDTLNKKLSKDIEINIIKYDSIDYEISESEREILNEYMSNLSIEDKVGQILSVNIDGTLQVNDNGLYILNDDEEVYINEYLGDCKVSNIIIDISNVTSLDSLSKTAEYIQKRNKQNNNIGGYIGLSMPILRYSLQETQFDLNLPNAAIGAIEDTTLIENYYKNMAIQYANCGINVLYTSAYAKGYYSHNIFSRNMTKQLVTSSILRKELRNRDIIMCSVFMNYFTNDEYPLLDNMIKDGIEMFSPSDLFDTKSPYYSSLCNSNCVMMYNITSSYEMTYNNVYDALKKGINFINAYVLLGYSSAGRFIQLYNDLVSGCASDAVLMSLVNDSVKKVLLSKIRNNIIEPKIKNETISYDKKILNKILDNNQTIDIINEDKFKPLDNMKKTFIISDNGLGYNIPNAFRNNKNEYGFNNVTTMIMTKNIYQSDFSNVTKNDQVVLVVDSNVIDMGNYNYSYWSNVINTISIRTKNIIIINLATSYDIGDLSHSKYPIINMNYGISIDYKNIFDILVK